MRFTFGTTKVSGSIVEDRGDIGVGRRRLYRVRFQFDENDEPSYIELPGADLELVSPAMEPSKKS